MAPDQLFRLGGLVSGEAWDYINERLERLVALATRDDEIGTRARSGLGSKLRGLVLGTRLEDVEAAVEAVICKSGS